MIRNIHYPSAGHSPPPDGIATGHAVAEASVYDRSFWLCYLANTMLMIAVSLLFRYADFVTQLGGSERHLGVIVGTGMIGAVAVRLLLGTGIDRYSPRPIWLGALVLFIVAALGHLAVHTVHGPWVYLMRVLLTIGIAGGVGASLTYVSLRVPESRIAEIVGMIGTSGFVGLAIGPVVGDFLFRTPVITRQQIDWMFLLAAFVGTIALVAATLATGGQVQRRRKRRHPALFPLIRRYQPGVILLVALAMGLGIGLPSVFVRAYAAEMSIVGIRNYFLVYALVAFTVRVTTRRWTQRLGIRTVILIGLSALSASMVLYLVVHQAWQLAIPAAVAGFAHALLFPAIVAGGSISFPVRYRGLATTLVLGMFDVGNLIGQPAIGNTLYYAERFGLPKYPTMFMAVALFMIAVAVFYARRSAVPRQNRRRYSQRRSAAAGLPEQPARAMKEDARSTAGPTADEPALKRR